MTRGEKLIAQWPPCEEKAMPRKRQSSLSPWPENPSPKRLMLTNYARAYRVAQRLFERHGVPVAIIEQQCAIQSHCVVAGADIFKLKLKGEEAKPYRLVTTVF